METTIEGLLMKATISSYLVASIIEASHKSLVSVLCDMAVAGEFDQDKLPTKGGEVRSDRQIHLGLADVMALTKHFNLPRRTLDKLSHEVTLRAASRAVREPLDPERLLSVFGDRPMLVGALQGLLDGADTGQARKLGIRLVDDMIWIGTSTHYMSSLAKFASLEPTQLSQMLSTVSGAVRHGTKKFGRENSRVVAIPLVVFQRLVNQAT